MFIFVVCALLSGVLAQQCYNLDVECDTWTEYCHRKTESTYEYDDLQN